MKKSVDDKGFNLVEVMKKFWHYIWYDDSFGSYIANFIFAFVVIKYLLFPGLGFVLNNDYPIVAIVSGSMEHKVVGHRICDKAIVDVESMGLDFDEFWSFCGSYYEKNYNISSGDFLKFEYKNGLNIGDVMVLYGKNPEKIDVGEVLIFIPEDRSFFEQKGPVIHRVVNKWQDDNGRWFFATKGDHNDKSYEHFETIIPEEDVIGTTLVRIPFVGYVKIMIFEIFMKARGAFF